MSTVVKRRELLNVAGQRGKYWFIKFLKKCLEIFVPALEGDFNLKDYQPPSEVTQGTTIVK